MSSCVAVEPSATPSTGDSITRIHALFGVFRYAPLLSSPPTTSDADTNAAVMTDRRIVRVTGPLVHSDILSKVLWFVGESIEGVHVKTIPIASEWCYGMAVNLDETMMVVSCSELARGNGNKLYLYSLPGGELLRTIGEKGVKPGQLDMPRRVCFGPDDVIIVADMSNNRLQEFSFKGEFKRIIDVAGAYSVCVSNGNHMIGVGTGASSIVLLGYGSGAVIRTITGTSTSIVCGVAFTRDDTHILAFNVNSPSVMMFQVSDGVYVRKVCDSLHGASLKDVCPAPNGDLVVAEYCNHRICVLTSDGSESMQQRRFGREGTGDGQFKHPTALSLVKGRLYVLDRDTPRVQVFV